MILSLCFNTFLLYYLGQSLQTSLNTRFLVPEKCILLSIDGFNWSQHIHNIFSTVPSPQQVLSKYCYFHPMTTHLGHLKKKWHGKIKSVFCISIWAVSSRAVSRSTDSATSNQSYFIYLHRCNVSFLFLQKQIYTHKNCFTFFFPHSLNQMS